MAWNNRPYDNLAGGRYVRWVSNYYTRALWINQQTPHENNGSHNPKFPGIWFATSAAFIAKETAWPTAQSSEDSRPYTTRDTPKKVQSELLISPFPSFLVYQEMNTEHQHSVANQLVLP